MSALLEFLHNATRHVSMKSVSGSQVVSPIVVQPPVIVPAKEKHTATMIFLHGMGSPWWWKGTEWPQVFANNTRLDYVKYIVPQAVQRPVTLNFGLQSAAWYDVFGLSEKARQDEVGIEIAKAYVHGLIDEEIASGTPANRIILGGFSMGGALAVYAGLTYRRQLGCIVSLSGFLLQQHKFPGEHEANLRTPIFLGQGTKDIFVPAAVGKRAYDALVSFNPNVQFRLYSKGHRSMKEEQEDVNNFISVNVPKESGSE